MDGEPGSRQAQLEADLTAAKRATAAWRMLLGKSARVFASFSKTMSDALEASTHSSTRDGDASQRADRDGYRGRSNPRELVQQSMHRCTDREPRAAKKR
jgi:hypothetical protein